MNFMKNFLNLFPAFQNHININDALIITNVIYINLMKYLTLTGNILLSPAILTIYPGWYFGNKFRKFFFHYH